MYTHSQIETTILLNPEAFFMGLPIYRYELKRTNNKVKYKFVSLKITPNNAVNKIAIMFQGSKERMNLYCNGKLIHQYNYSPFVRYITMQSKMNYKYLIDIHE